MRQKREVMCVIHSSKNIEFVCIDNNCKNSSAFCCFMCIRNEHKNCNDDSIIEYADYMGFTIEINNTQGLNNTMLNRAHSDMRIASSKIKSSLLKKKDLLIDFCYLNDQDFIENFAQIFKIYSEFLFYDYNNRSKETTISSHFKFMSPSQIKKTILSSFENDINNYLSKHFDFTNKSLLSYKSDLHNEFNFDSSKLKIISKNSEKNIFEIIYKQSNEHLSNQKNKDDLSLSQDIIYSLGSSDSESLSSKEFSSCSSKLILFESKIPLRGNNIFK